MAAAPRLSALCVLVIALATLASCCRVAPSISSISPSSATAGASEVTLTINGSGFLCDAVVDFNGTTVTPNSVTSHQLVATIPSTDLAEPATLQVLVLNPPGSFTCSSTGKTITTPTECGGNDSNVVSFTVSP